MRSNIEKGILASAENSVRFRTIKKHLENVNLEKEYVRYEERSKMKKVLENYFCDTKYQGDIEKI